MPRSRHVGAASGARRGSRAPASVRRCRSRKSSPAATLKATALPAMTCSSGPPCWPGKTAELIFLAISASFVRMMPPRGPPQRLVGGRGDDVRRAARARGAAPPRPGRRSAPCPRTGRRPTSSAIRRNSAKSRCRGYADHPAMIILGRCSWASRSHLRHVDQVGVLAYAVGDDVVEPTGEVEPHAVRQVAAVGEVETEDGVARREQRVHDRRVGLGARVRLDVGVRRRRTAP